MSPSTRKGQVSKAALISGVTMMCVGALFMLLTVLGNVLGPAGKAIKDFFLGAFGLSFYAFLAALIVLGIFLVRGYKPTLRPFKIFCIVAIYLLAVLILHLVTTRTMLAGDAAFNTYISQCFKSNLTFGGVVFGVFVYPVEWLVGEVFSYILYSFLIVVLAFAWTDFVIFRRLGERKPATGAVVHTSKPEEDKKRVKPSFARGGEYAQTSGFNDVGTRKLFVDSIKPVPASAPRTVQTPKYTEYGAPISPVSGVHETMRQAGRRPQAAPQSTHLPDYISDKYNVQKNEPTPASSPSVSMPYVADSRPQKVVHSADIARDRENVNIIDGESRSRELEELRRREEKVAEAERKLKDAEQRPTQSAPAPRATGGRIIVGDEESKKIEERKKAQDAATKELNGARRDKPRDFYQPAVQNQSGRLFSGTVSDTKRPDSIFLPPKPAQPSFQTRIDRELQQPAQPPKPVDQEHVSSSPYQSQKPTDGLDFSRAFKGAQHDEAGDTAEEVTDADDYLKLPDPPKTAAKSYNLFDMFSSQDKKTEIRSDAQADEDAELFGEHEDEDAEQNIDPLDAEPVRKPIPPIRLAPIDEPQEEQEDIDEEFIEDEEREYLPPTSKNIRKAASNDRNFARQQLGLDDYRQERAAEMLGSESDFFSTSDDPYYAPPVDLLENNSTYTSEITEEIIQKGEMLTDKLAEFKIPCEVKNIRCGPAVSLFELQVAEGVPIGRVRNYEDDIAYALASRAGVRILTPIPGKTAVGVEVPNETVGIVSLREIMETDAFTSSKSPLSFAIGTDIEGNRITANLIEMEHLLVAGSTGSGKSSCLNSLIVSMISHASPEDVRLILIDPKRVEFSIYNGLPHLLLDRAITDWENALNALVWLIKEYERRFMIFSSMAVRNLAEYRKHPDVVSGKREKLPYIVLIIDELADLMMNNKTEFEEKIRAIGQKARAAGIHMVIATQRPSVDVLTGTIKANLVSRVAFAVTAAVDSRVILDQQGAESLLGRGDMLYLPKSLNSPKRIQGAYVTDDECRAVVNFIKNNNESVYDERIHDAVYPKKVEIEETDTSLQTSGNNGNPPSDELLLRVLWFFIEQGKATISMAQRRFRIGFNRAANIVDELEMKQFIGNDGLSKERVVLISREDFVNRFGEQQ